MMQLTNAACCIDPGILIKPSPHVLLGLIILSISIISMAGPSIAIEHQTLNGKVYATILNGEKDTLTFRDGLFHSELSSRRGHDKGGYTTAAHGNTIWFEATTVSPDEGEFMWRGVIEGNAINGSYLYTQKGWFLFGDTTKKRHFEGSLKAE